jgi:hypothetical protein
MAPRFFFLFIVVSPFAAGCSSGDPSPSNTAPSLLEPRGDVSDASARGGVDSDDRAAAAALTEPPAELLALFEQMDEFGRDRVKDARFVTATFVNPDAPDKEFSQQGWLVAEDDETITLLQDDLIPWIYDRRKRTTIPISSWGPAVWQFKSVVDGDFATICRLMSQPRIEREFFRTLFDAGPSHRLLVAHAAWKKGQTDVAAKILGVDPQFAVDKATHRKSVLDDLAWLHFVRGVNLLMFADRTEVLPHLRLVPRLSPESDFGTDVQDLISRIERLIADGEKGDVVEIDESGLDEAGKAKFFISQLRDVQYRQMGQPGGISPSIAYDGNQEEENPPTNKLARLGMPGIPALIEALGDDTPTRSIVFPRDFMHERHVLRVSDLAAAVLRALSAGYFKTSYQVITPRRHTAVYFSQAAPDVRYGAIQSIQRWYEKNKDLSKDDRMLGLFTDGDEEDWIKAGRYFLAKNDKRAVAPLLANIRKGGWRRKADLCELVAEFGDPAVRPVLHEVLKDAKDESERMSAAIGLWELGDARGVPVAIEYVLANDQPLSRWGDPIWLLIKSHTSEGIDALQSVLAHSPIERAREIMLLVEGAITDGGSRSRSPIGCVEICPLLVAAMRRTEPTGGSINGVNQRFKDRAAKTLAVMRQGLDDPEESGYVHLDPLLFNETEPDEKKRDAQIEALSKWYEENKDKLIWDSKFRKLIEKSTE